MNKFHKPGFIEYNGRFTVHSSLLNIILQDQVSFLLSGLIRKRSEVNLEK